MKKLLIILMVGNLYADTIVYKSGSKNRTIENVEYIKAGNGKVYFKAHGGEVSRDCSKVVTFTNNVGNPIDYDCSAVLIEESLIDLEKKIEDTISEDDVELIIKKTKKPVAGGVLIAIGGGLLFSVSGSECDDCDTIEKANEFADGVKSSSQLGYLMITIGGILVAIGI